jgi:hypothetical protein
MQVKVKVYKRVLVSYEVEVNVREGYDKDSLIQAVYEYSPDSLDKWDDEADTDYDDRGRVPKPELKELADKGLYFDGERIAFKP